MDDHRFVMDDFLFYVIQKKYDGSDMEKSVAQDLSGGLLRADRRSPQF
jgi:hypothetical protein